MISRVNCLLVGNKWAAEIGVRYVNWGFWLIVAWLAVSVTFAAVFGRVVRARDQREIPPLDQDNDGERSRRTPAEACKCKRRMPL